MQTLETKSILMYTFIKSYLVQPPQRQQLPVTHTLSVTYLKIAWTYWYTGILSLNLTNKFKHLQEFVFHKKWQNLLQITTYAHKDFNNEWIIKLADQEPKPDDPVQLVVSGDLVRLEHRE